MVNVQDCLYCSKSIADNEKSSDNVYTCDGCNGFVHSSCAGLSTSEAKCMALKRRTLKFLCNDCNIGLKDLPSLKNLIMELKRDIANLKQQSNTCNCQYANDIFMQDKLVREFEDRDERKSNLIIFNLPEEDREDNEEKKSNDKNQVEMLVRSAG
uniref:PHD-type domain-containing protein n=2 Tax=Rhodnius prolixus TaxID=13249 RepID=T1HXZ6_RHOPR